MKLEEIFRTVLKEEEELKRVHMSDMAAHFKQKTYDIKKGLKITENVEYTEILKRELSEWENTIQKGRKQGNTSIEFKSIENEWEELMKVFREYDIATYIHNRNYPKNKIRKIRERIGFNLTESVDAEE